MSGIEIAIFIAIGFALVILSVNLALLRNDVRRLRIRLKQTEEQRGIQPYDEFE